MSYYCMDAAIRGGRVPLMTLQSVSIYLHIHPGLVCFVIRQYFVTIFIVPPIEIVNHI